MRSVCTRRVTSVEAVESVRGSSLIGGHSALPVEFHPVCEMVRLGSVSDAVPLRPCGDVKRVAAPEDSSKRALDVQTREVGKAGQRVLAVPTEVASTHWARRELSEEGRTSWSARRSYSSRRACFASFAADRATHPPLGGVEVVETHGAAVPDPRPVC